MGYQNCQTLLKKNQRVLLEMGGKNWLTKKLMDMLICNEWIHELENRTKVVSDNRAQIYKEMVNSMEGRITSLPSWFRVTKGKET